MFSIWHDTVTVYHKHYIKNTSGKDVPEWTRRTYTNCFVRVEWTSAQNDHVQNKTDNAIFRLPLRAIVDTGDVIVKGRSEYVPPIATSAMTIINNNKNAFMVKAVHMNDQIQPVHVYVEGV